MGHRRRITVMALALLVSGPAVAQTEPETHITDWPPATLDDFSRATWSLYELVCGPIPEGGGPGTSTGVQDCDNYWIVLQDIMGTQTILWQRQQENGLTGTVPPFPELEDRVVGTLLARMEGAEPDWTVEWDEGLEDIPMPMLEQLAGIHATTFTNLTRLMVDRALLANPDIVLPD